MYIRAPLGVFADLTTAYFIPDGYDQALYSQLSLILQIPYGRVASQELKDLARDSFATIKRSNIRISDLANDFAQLGGRTRRGYNLQTGE
jgi:hypothetical protein